MYGTDRSVVNARIDVHMMVNLICHCGSTVYELCAVSMTTGGRSVEEEVWDALVNLELGGDDRYEPLAEAGRCWGG
jgi:hypothetical protein